MDDLPTKAAVQRVINGIRGGQALDPTCPLDQLPPDASPADTDAAIEASGLNVTTHWKVGKRGQPGYWWAYVQTADEQHTAFSGLADLYGGTRAGAVGDAARRLVRQIGNYVQESVVLNEVAQ